MPSRDFGNLPALIGDHDDRQLYPTACDPSMAAVETSLPPPSDPWHGVVAALGGDLARVPGKWPKTHRRRLTLPGEQRGSDAGSEHSRVELDVPGLVSSRPYTAAQFAAAMQVELRVACARIARMRARGLIERTARGWPAVEIGMPAR